MAFAHPKFLMHVDSTGESTPSHRSLAPSSHQLLRSPAPPPPANLYEGGAAAFNVDPGIPFLATAGPTEAGSSDGGSIKEESPREMRFVGGFVTGIKKAVRNSLRDRMRSQQAGPPLPMRAQPPQFRDSGYARSASQLYPPPPIAPSQVNVDYHASHHAPARPPSETFLGHHPHQHKHNDETTVTWNQQIFSPEVMPSPISAESEYASDYAMLPDFPPSENSLKSYIRRASKLVHDISTLPWVETERITADYYPGKRRDKASRHPAFTWGSHSDSGVSSETR